MEDWEIFEIDTLCNKLEGLGSNYLCRDRYYDYDTQGNEDHIEFMIYYLDEPAFRISINGYMCRSIYEDKDAISKLNTDILKILKVWKMHKYINEIESDFTEDK